MPIIISKRGAGTIRVDASGVPEETMLQEYVQEHPEVLPLDEIREDIRLMIAAKEFPTNSGPIDVLAFDPTGEIYIIESKLYKNPDKRQVLAQALDYGASLWHGYTSGEKFTADIRAAFRRVSNEPLEEEIRATFGLDDGEVQELLATLETNLGRGIFKFVVLMDRMDDRLKDLITFVNENSRFTVYGVELEFYQHEDLEIVIPKLFGAEVKKDVSTSSPRRKWDEQSYFEDALQKLAPNDVQAMRRLFSYVKEECDELSWGTGVTMGSFSPKFQSLSPRSLFALYSDGRLCMNFGYIGDDVGKEALWRGVREDLGWNISEQDYDKYPHVPVDEWGPKVVDFLELLDRLRTDQAQKSG